MSTVMSAPALIRVSLAAPVVRVLVPIEQVPDPLFSQRMVGDGIWHLIVVLNADQYAAEIRGQLTAQLEPV